MNFNNAIKKLEEGEHIRRPMWEENSYWKLGKHECICWTDGKTAHIHLNQIKACDWEVVEKQKNKFLQKRDADWICLKCGKFGIGSYALHQMNECKE